MLTAARSRRHFSKIGPKHVCVVYVCVGAAASVEQQALLSDSQEDTPPQLRDEVDSTQLQPPDTGMIAV